MAFSDKEKYLEPAYRSYKLLVTQLGYKIEKDFTDYSDKSLNNIMLFCTKVNDVTKELEYYFYFVMYTSKLSLEEYAKALNDNDKLMDFAQMIVARMVPFTKSEVIYMLLANRYIIDDIYQNKEIKITDREIILLMHYANQKASFK